MRGLYVHIPFCTRKCHYCNYVIAPDPSARDRESFFAAIESETAHAASRYGRLSFDTLYLGGGTPSLLSAGEMERLLDLLRRNFDFGSGSDHVPSLGTWSGAAGGAEVTCEMNPGDADAAKLSAYRAMGLNRASVGVQSLDDGLLGLMGRAHDAAAARMLLRMLGETGFANVSADLIIRLPGQTSETVVASLEEVIGLGAGQVVIYDLNVHAETVFGGRARRGELELPGETAHEAMFASAEAALSRAGFRQYEVSSFARPGFESRHNLIYWKNREYLGLGPGAFSYMEGRRSVLAPDFRSYLDKCARRDWTPHEEDVLTPIEREIETFLTGLRLAEGVEWERFPLLEDHWRTETARLEARGLIERKDGRARLTRRGKYLAETVFTQLATCPEQSRGAF